LREARLVAHLRALILESPHNRPQPQRRAKVIAQAQGRLSNFFGNIESSSNYNNYTCSKKNSSYYSESKEFFSGNKGRETKSFFGKFFNSFRNINNNSSREYNSSTGVVDSSEPGGAHYHESNTHQSATQQCGFKDKDKNGSCMRTDGVQKFSSKRFSSRESINSDDEKPQLYKNFSTNNNYNGGRRPPERLLQENFTRDYYERRKLDDDDDDTTTHISSSASSSTSTVRTSTQTFNSYCFKFAHRGDDYEDAYLPLCCPGRVLHLRLTPKVAKIPSWYGRLQQCKKNYTSIGPSGSSMKVNQKKGYHNNSSYINSLFKNVCSEQQVNNTRNVPKMPPSMPGCAYGLLKEVRRKHQKILRRRAKHFGNNNTSLYNCINTNNNQGQGPVGGAGTTPTTAKSNFTVSNNGSCSNLNTGAINGMGPPGSSGNSRTTKFQVAAQIFTKKQLEEKQILKNSSAAAAAANNNSTKKDLDFLRPDQELASLTAARTQKKQARTEPGAKNFQSAAAGKDSFSTSLAKNIVKNDNAFGSSGGAISCSPSGAPAAGGPVSLNDNVGCPPDGVAKKTKFANSSGSGSSSTTSLDKNSSLTTRNNNIPILPAGTRGSPTNGAPSATNGGTAMGPGPAAAMGPPGTAAAPPQQLVSGVSGICNNNGGDINIGDSKNRHFHSDGTPIFNPYWKVFDCMDNVERKLNDYVFEPVWVDPEVEFSYCYSSWKVFFSSYCYSSWKVFFSAILLQLVEGFFFPAIATARRRCFFQLYCYSSWKVFFFQLSLQLVEGVFFSYCYSSWKVFFSAIATARGRCFFQLLLQLVEGVFFSYCYSSWKVFFFQLSLQLVEAVFSLFFSV